MTRVSLAEEPMSHPNYLSSTRTNFFSINGPSVFSGASHNVLGDPPVIDLRNARKMSSQECNCSVS